MRIIFGTVENFKKQQTFPFHKSPKMPFKNEIINILHKNCRFRKMSKIGFTDSKSFS